MADLEKLGAISAALREPMPEGFMFDLGTYRRDLKEIGGCGTIGCALGLAWTIGILSGIRHVGTIDIDSRVELGINYDEYTSLFMPSGYKEIYEYRSPTARDVADKIDRFIKAQPVLK